MEVPIDRFLLPKDLQAMLEVYIQCVTRATFYCFKIVKARVKTYNNMAQAQMKLTAWDSAFSSIRQVMSVFITNLQYIFAVPVYRTVMSFITYILID